MSVLKVTLALGTVLVGGTGTYLTWNYLSKNGESNTNLSSQDDASKLKTDEVKAKQKNVPEENQKQLTNADRKDPKKRP